MSAAAVDVRLTAYDLEQAVRERYEAPEWRVESEVTLANRRLDLVALNLWSARQFRIVGFELKVDRGDWMRELNAFQKSEEWAAVVDAFYVVTSPKIIRADELPDGWGHLELTGSRMMTRRHAVSREGRTTMPREIAARFIGRLAQAADRQDREAEIRARHAIRDEIQREVEERAGKDAAQLREEYQRTRQDYEALLRALGIGPTSWRAQESALHAAGVYAKMQGDAASIRAQMAREADRLADYSRRLREASEAMMDGAA